MSGTTRRIEEAQREAWDRFRAFLIEDVGAHELRAESLGADDEDGRIEWWAVPRGGIVLVQHYGQPGGGFAVYLLDETSDVEESMDRVRAYADA